jgi:FkbM family methyltransferase
MLKILPFKKQVYTVLKKLGPPPERIYKRLHFHGPFDVHYEGKKAFRLLHHGYVEENEIFWNDLDNGWEKKTIALWIALCKKRSNILDIGANTGLFGIAAKAFSPAANVHCFEPLEGVVNILNQNAALNSFDIQVHKLALSDHDGTADVFLPDEKEFVYSVTVNQDTVAKHRKSRKVEIQIRSLDTMIAEGLVPVPDLIKIDVERHEYEVLTGMKKTLQSACPDLIIEVLDEEQAAKLNTVFNGMDYLYFNIDDAEKSVRQTSKIEKSDYWNYLVCKPQTAKELQLI